MQKIIVAFIALLFTYNSTAQDSIANFTTSIKDYTSKEKILVLHGVANKGIKILSIKYVPTLEVQTKITFDTSIKKYVQDSIIETGNAIILKGDDLDQFNITGYDSVTWQQKIILQPKDSIRITGTINYSYKDVDGGIKGGVYQISKQFFYSEITTTNTATLTDSENLKSKSIWGLFIAGLIAGLIGFISPCVYALVPVTVSMFLKKSKTPAQGRKNIFVYAFSILAIYTLIGVLTGVVIPETTIYTLSTHWIFNLIIFVLFVIFGMSFLGAFEITLPASWANKMDSKASTKSYTGIFFMAFTLVIVSFSCTGPFVGSLLATSFSNGKLGPALGMFGFGLGLAAPFAIFAIFPKLLTVLTKSGGWQNALKVTLGFIELALALKFLSNADGVKGWHLLDREIFLVIWIVLFILLGIYLLGKITFKLDSELPKNDFGISYLPVPRLLLAITSLCFALYMIPGLWGAPLNGIGGFLPAAGTQDFYLVNGSGSTSEASSKNVLPPNKYVAFLKKQEPAAALQNGFVIYYSYDETLAASKILKKPILIDFTGITCVNCRKFESAIWTNKAVAQVMKNDFVLLSLYVDHKEELNDTEKYFSPDMNQQINTTGERNIDLQKRLVNSYTQPNYVFIDNEGKLLYNQGYGYNPNQTPADFLAHMEKIKMEYKKRNP
jgi:cytochrome c biogenesis protein CcdA/thioredoxin-related protein